MLNNNYQFHVGGALVDCAPTPSPLPFIGTPYLLISSIFSSIL